MKPNSTHLALFSLRISIFILMIVWATLKVMAPGAYAGAEDSPGIFENFYGVGTGPSIVLVLGILQIVLLLAFLAGAFKTITYGAVALMNGVTLLVSIPTILSAFGPPPAILFVASVPIFGASLALFLMRKQDQFLSIQK